jgi:hypothetical protein
MVQENRSRLKKTVQDQSERHSPIDFTSLIDQDGLIIRKTRGIQ